MPMMSLLRSLKLQRTVLLLCLVVLPFSVYLNDNHSIDLEFYQSVGEVEIEISQGGIVILSYSEDITSLMLRNIQLQSDAFGWFVIH